MRLPNTIFGEHCTLHAMAILHNLGTHPTDKKKTCGLSNILGRLSVQAPCPPILFGQTLDTHIVTDVGNLDIDRMQTAPNR